MRKGIIAIIVVAVLVVGYVVGIATTKKATYSAIENLVLEMERQGNVDVQAEWLEQNSRSAVLQLSVVADSGVPEMGEVAYNETVQLQYGFLNTKWRSEGDFTMADFSGKEHLFNGELITAEGAVSRGGLRLQYTIPAIRFTEMPGMEVFAEPMLSTFIMAGDDIRGNVVVPEIGFTDMGANNVVLRDMRFDSNTRILNGEFFSNVTTFAIGKVEALLEEMPAPAVVTDITSSVELRRKDDTLVSSGTFALASLDAGPAIAGSGDLAWSMEGINYVAFQALEEYLQNVDANDNEDEIFERLANAVLASEQLSFALEHLTIETPAWGNVRASGNMQLNFADMNEKQRSMLKQNANFQDYLEAELTIAELPGLVQLMVTALSADPMPWKMEWKNGLPYLNGELLDLGALQ